MTTHLGKLHDPTLRYSSVYDRNAPNIVAQGTENTGHGKNWNFFLVDA